MAKRLYSLEFFPPRTPEGVEKLRAARKQLGQLKPAFCSVTFGAGGSTRAGTLETVLEIRGEGVPAAPHISCIGSTRENVAEVLAQYRTHGIRHLVALRGDMPSGTGAAGEFHYACLIPGLGDRMRRRDSWQKSTGVGAILLLTLLMLGAGCCLFDHGGDGMITACRRTSARSCSRVPPST